jgi:alkanesulfonate monooxygenase SsuD/methylene tetrahydromethanopterin reductase-like flavin-dependent oxidoreductase (luciferase family)
VPPPETSGQHRDVPWGVLLPTFDQLHTGRTPPLIAAARRAEELGFDAGWVGDHLACNAPVLDSVTALGAAAAVTDRLSLGFSVMLLGLRDPVQAARQIVTVDALCGGRLSLGVGVGGEHPEEFVAAGVSPTHRGRRLDEMLTVVPALIAGEAVEFAGQTVAVSRPASSPARVPRVLVGGRGEAALRRVARSGDGWLPMWLSPDALREGAARLAELLVDRPATTVPIVLLALVCVDDDLDRARRTAAAHLDGQYRLPLKAVERWTLLGPPAVVAEELRHYLDAGVSELILMPLGPQPLQQYERVADVRQRLLAMTH